MRSRKPNTLLRTLFVNNIKVIIKGNETTQKFDKASGFDKRVDILIRSFAMISTIPYPSVKNVESETETSTNPTNIIANI